LNKAILQLDRASLLPEIDDDYVQTPAGKPVVVYPLGVEVDFAARGWELTLLNDPPGGVATVTSDGAVKFTPNQGFIGAATIHFLIEDQHHNDTSATVTVEVQNHFAFHSAESVNKGTPRAAIGLSQSCNETGILASKVFSVIAEPLFAGTAAPGAELVGRIYNQCGSLAGESMLTADVDGCWEMYFKGTKALEFYRVEVEQVVAEGRTPGRISLHPNEAAWQSV
jgi:hypothetical protein